MGVYINMEMPKNCAECFVGFCKQIGCEHYIGFDDYDRARHPDCPLIEVPEPHGRLIDEKDICDKIRPLIENPFCYNRLQVISETLGNCLQIVSDAPTIIPASEEGET